MNTKPLVIVVVVLLAWIQVGCTDSKSAAELAEIRKTQQMEQANLANFDDLDFNVYSGQKWDELGKSHSKDIVVHWPDGRTTTGIEPHIEDLKAMFVFAPDTRIKEHPIKIASGEWTAVAGRGRSVSQCRSATARPSRRPARRLR